MNLGEICLAFSLTFLLQLACSENLYAQVDYQLEESIIEGMHPLDGDLLDENTSVSFIVDNTKTKLGSDFYEIFYTAWLTAQQDTTAKIPRQALIDQEIAIEIEELPYPGLTGIIGLKIDNELVWQQLLQMKGEAKETQALEAALFLYQYLSSYEEMRQQLSSDDQSGTGIF